MACSKIGFSTKKDAIKDAKITLADMKRLGNTNRGIKRLRPYECWHCGMWHLTTQKQLKKPKPKIET